MLGSGDIGGSVGIGAGGQARRVAIEDFKIGPVDIRQGRVVTSD
jgi:hypothetical protein